MTSDKSNAYAAAEGRDFLAGELRDKSPKYVREFSGLIDDRKTLDLLNYYCSLYRDVGEEFLETRLAQTLISNAATGTIDEAFRAGNVSQLKGMTGLTSQTRDGEDLLSESAKRLSDEGSIGLVLGPPGSGKTALTLDVARIWKARTGGTVIGNTSWGGFDSVVSSDRELLTTMGHTDGPVLAVIDETAQELSGFGSGNKAAEEFSDSLTFVRKKEEKHGPHAKKGSVLMVNHTRTKTAKCFRDLCTFAVEKPSRHDPGRARLLDSEGGKDTFEEKYTVQGITDTSESYSEHEASEFEIVGSEGSEEAEEGPDAETVRREEAIRTAITAVEDGGMGYKETAALVDYSKEWVGKIYRNWRDENKHTAIVPKEGVSD
jgi:energy-coupling factor transporter ATP-binding protein EcfA2